MTRIQRLIHGAALSAALLGAPALAADAEGRPTEPFRREHQQLHQHLDRVDALVGSLTTARPGEQKAAMNQVVQFLEDDILAHARWEEKALYPAVDKRAAKGPNPFTASMRYEHKIIERWVGELAAIAQQPKPDPVAFQRQADKILGVIAAHFEEEEQVLLPILDKTMTKQQFEKEIGSKA